MIDISQTAGGHTIQNNHFEVNPLDPRPVVSPVPPVQWWGIKNQGFLYGLLDTLGSTATFSAASIAAPVRVRQA